MITVPGRSESVLRMSSRSLVSVDAMAASSFRERTRTGDDGGMCIRIDRLLDDTGWQVLATLQENARIPFSELGRRVGLSAPAVAERVRRMEDAGIIAGYGVRLGFEQLGRPITR